MNNMRKITKLRKQNKQLKETCEILADKRVMADIQKSLKQIAKGKYIRASEL